MKAATSNPSAATSNPSAAARKAWITRKANRQAAVRSQAAVLAWIARRAIAS